MMRFIKKAYIFIFALVLFVPIVLFNSQKGAVSEIDNKVLMENPFAYAYKHKDFKGLRTKLESYISERIGLRSEMILAYTIANDKLFGEMVHPTYMYGKDGYVFFKADKTKKYGEFEDAFVNMLCRIQNYCNERNVPFVFVFEPAKLSVLRNKLPEGYIYDNKWVEIFLHKLDKNKVNYVDNTILMKQCTEKNIAVFNVKYNAGHWNDMGAFYGMNNALSNLNRFNNAVHVNDLQEFSITQKLNTTLPVSKFPIHEYETVFTSKKLTSIESFTDKYAKEIELDKRYKYFAYTVNTERLDPKKVRALVFQGSYINGMGYKFLQNSFSEYIAVHDYQNVLNFDYYFNIFKPDCVIFDAAEYTFANGYFNYKKMKEFTLNPLLSTFDDYNTLNIQAGGGKFTNRKQFDKNNFKRHKC